MTWSLLDTFSGLGGFSLAAEWTGRIHPVQFVERDAFCRRVLAKHWPGVPIAPDIRDFAMLGRIDLITGGFPCQPFSVAGQQGGGSDSRYLWPELARIVRVLRPRWALFENVAGIVNMADGLERVWTDLEGAGYEVGATVIPAAAVGAPHKRDRVWIVAFNERDFGARSGDGSPVERWNVRDRLAGGLPASVALEVEAASTGIRLQELAKQGTGKEVEDHPASPILDRGGDGRGSRSYQSESGRLPAWESTHRSALRELPQPDDRGRRNETGGSESLARGDIHQQREGVVGQFRDGRRSDGGGSESQGGCRGNTTTTPAYRDGGQRHGAERTLRAGRTAAVSGSPHAPDAHSVGWGAPERDIHARQSDAERGCIAPNPNQRESRERPLADVFGRWSPSPEQTGLGGGGIAAADPDDQREQQQSRSQREEWRRLGDSSPHAPDPSCELPHRTGGTGAGWRSESSDRRNAPDTTSRGPRCGSASWPAGQPARAGEDAADSGYQRREVPLARGFATESFAGSNGAARGIDAQSGLGAKNDGLSRWLAGRLAGGPFGAFGPEWEAGIARTHSGSAERREELMALGNAIVPQIAFVILQAMLEADEAVSP